LRVNIKSVKQKRRIQVSGRSKARLELGLVVVVATITILFLPLIRGGLGRGCFDEGRIECIVNLIYTLFVLDPLPASPLVRGRS
jgi:hypothetical protein